MSDPIFVKNVVLWDAFLRIQALFEANNIPVMPLKGIALLFSVYQDIGLRPMADIDFLVRKDDVVKAARLLSDLGYRKDSAAPFNYSKKKGKARISLDMQYSLWYLKPLPPAKARIYGIDKIWEDSQRIHFDNNSARIMACEDLLINVAAHAGVDHARFSDTWMRDIAHISERYQHRLNWHMFIDKVRSYGIEIPVGYILECAKYKLNAAIPQFVLEGLKPKQGNAWRLWLYNRALKGGYIPRAGHLLRILIVSRLLGQARLILFYLFPDAQFMVLRYNIKSSRRVYFYYPLRALFLLIRTAAILSAAGRRLGNGQTIRGIP